MVCTEENKKLAKLRSVRSQVSRCKRCVLYATRTNAVPGEGNEDASIMFIGEAPGRNEDLQGKPFVGRAGGILDELLASIGLTRDDIFIANILKCRPPGNRNPRAEEIAACIGSLDLQLKTINPEVICTLGNFSTSYIFEKYSIPAAKISEVRGTIIPITTPSGESVVVPMFHPAVATYDPRKKETLLKDFKVLKKYC